MWTLIITNAILFFAYGYIITQWRPTSIGATYLRAASALAAAYIAYFGMMHGAINWPIITAALALPAGMIFGYIIFFNFKEKKTNADDHDHDCGCPKKGNSDPKNKS